jgi:hypothetical protein
MTRDLKKPLGTYTLRPIQASALHEMQKHRGLVAPIGVGHGKSLIALLAGRVLESELTIIFCPASTVEQLKRTAVEMEQHFKLPSNYRIYSYSTLSQAKNTDLLPTLAKRYNNENILIVCDEAHRVKRMDSARTKRLIRFFQAHPKVKFVGLSGTFTSRSIHDYQHLSELALRQQSPVPMDNHHLHSWGEVLGVKGQPDRKDWITIKPLWDWYMTRPEGKHINHMYDYPLAERREIAQAAYKERLWLTSGVVATTSPSVSCSLYIANAPKLEMPDTLREMLDKAMEDGERPDGEILADPLELWRFTRQLCQGFYYVWDWPDGIEDTEWLEARRRWFSHVRFQLKNYSCEGYDSPLLVSNRVEAEYEQGSRRLYHRAWEHWQEQKQKPPPPTKPIWVDYYLIDYAVKWLEKTNQGRPAIVWFDTKAVADRLKKSGIPTFGAGEEVPTKAISCAMSIQAHGIGKNLQPWHQQLVLSPPESGLTWEQMLGRTHRQGQEADEVFCSVCLHAPPFMRAWMRAVADAKYIYRTTGNPQKLLYADVLFEF